jgi:hypothetical protein
MSIIFWIVLWGLIGSYISSLCDPRTRSRTVRGTKVVLRWIFWFCVGYVVAGALRDHERGGNCPQGPSGQQGGSQRW